MPCDDEETKRRTLSSGHPDTQLVHTRPYTSPSVDIVRHYSHENGVESTGGFFPDAIRLPAEMPEPEPPELHPEDLEPYSPVELVTLDEQRREESKRRRASIPFPETIFERPPLTRYSMVGAIEANAETLLGFLGALDFIAPRNASSSVLMSALASYDADPNQVTGEGELSLEATNGTTWAQVTMRAKSVRKENFRFSMPIGPSIAIMKLLRTQYRNVVIGMDRGEICIGPYSMPFAGLLDEFPPRDPILTGEARLALPAPYVRRIVECLVPLHSRGLRETTGVHLDVRERVALANDGERIHVVALANLPIETKSARIAPPGITVPSRFFEFLLAVVNQEWTAVEMNEEQITAVGEDFAISTRVTTEKFTTWRPSIEGIGAVCLVDRDALLSFLRQAVLFESVVTIEVVSTGDYLDLTARGRAGEQLRKHLAFQLGDGAMFPFHVKIDPVHTLQAVDVCLGGVIRLGFSRAPGAPFIIRGEGTDFAAILSTKEK